MKLFRLRTLHEWQNHSSKMEHEYRAREIYENDLEASLCTTAKNWRFNGLSYTAKQVVDFHIMQNVIPVNWRETILCPVTKLSNRVRASLHIFDTDCSPYKEDPLYITEQTTPTYKYLCKNFSQVKGSEFLGVHVSPGTVINGIQHENIVNLSFPDESLKHILCFDVFEHVPDYLTGFKECYRVLSSGGYLVWSVPFLLNAEKISVKSRIDDEGNIVHQNEPEYHTDQFNSQEILCYYHFGWELLRQVKNIGFADVYAVLYWSDLFGYLGREGIVFIARK